MLKYILTSLFISVCCLNVNSAEENKNETEQKSSSRNFKGVFLDVDVVEPMVSLMSDEHKGANISVSANFKDKLLPTVVAGYSKYDASDDYSNYFEQTDEYSYTVKGMYFKFGIDVNVISADPMPKYVPMGTIGLRYCFSPFSYDVNSSTVPNGYLQNDFNYSKSGNSFAQWGEIVVGVKMPIASRFFMGFQGWYKLKMHCKDDTEKYGTTNIRIQNSYAPGYGDSNSMSWGFRYLLSLYL